MRKIAVIVFCIMIMLAMIPVTCAIHIIQYDRLGIRTVPVASPQILWWYDLNAPSYGSAATGDIDEDGNLEIVFGTYFNDEHIYALNAEDGSLLWKYDTGGCNDASPAIADVDMDGKLEVIIPASSPSMVYCFNGATGKVKWSTSTGYANCIDSPPAVADVDGDSMPEVVVGTFNGYVFCLNGEDGSICWKINLGTDSYIQSEPDILDLDGDGALDVVVAQYAGDCRIYGLHGSDGSVLWHSDVPKDYMYHGGSFADIDEDGKLEIAIGCYDGHVYVINTEDGSLAWDYAAPYYIGAPTSIADLNKDNHLEIIFASYNKVGVLSNTGHLIWSYTTGDSIFRGVVISDIDGDHTLDIIFGADDGILRVLQGDNGHEIWTYDLGKHYGKTFWMDHAPIIADFNNDGKTEIFLVGGYGVYPPQDNYGRAYLLTGGEGTGPIWPMFRHDLRHSGCITQEQLPPDTPTITGPSQGKIKATCKYNISTIDPNGDEIYYFVDWGDGTNTSWIGPYPSGKEITINYTWTKQGTYLIKVKAKDSYGAESNWANLQVTIPKNKMIPKNFFKLLITLIFQSINIHYDLRRT